MVEMPLTLPRLSPAAANTGDPQLKRSAPQPTPAPGLAYIFVPRSTSQLQAGSVTRRDAPR